MKHIESIGIKTFAAELQALSAEVSLFARMILKTTPLDTLE